MLTIFKQKAEAARAEHSASIAPVDPPPYARRVKLILPQQAQPEKEGDDSAMAVDEGGEVSDAITGSFFHQSPIFKKVSQSRGRPKAAALATSTRKRKSSSAAPREAVKRHAQSKKRPRATSPVETGSDAEDSEGEIAKEIAQIEACPLFFN